MYKYNLITPFAHSLATVSCLILLINFSLTAGAHEFEFPQCTCYEKFHRQAVRLWWYVSLSSVQSSTNFLRVHARVHVSVHVHVRVHVCMCFRVHIECNIYLLLATAPRAQATNTGR